MIYTYINLGKLSYFTNLNLVAMNGDDSPNPNYDYSEGEQ